MKEYKKIDVILQTIAIIAGIITAIIGGMGGTLLNTDGGLFISGYFIVGGIQVVSCIVHIAARYKAGIARKIYNISLLVVAAIVVFAIFTSLSDSAIELLLALIFVAPVMAIYYWIVCYKEIQKDKTASEYNLNG